MKRKLFSIILAAIFVISLVGCSSAKPEDTVDVFLKNTQELNLEKMAESMNPDLKDSFDEITSEESDDSLSDYLDYFRKNAEKMSAIRQKFAGKLAEVIQKQLEDLNFLETNFQVLVEPTAALSANGHDEACFMISMNPGSPVKPLGDVASGGELSRIMLAIKTVLADKDQTETLIFDEIDVGISGRTAQKVSEKMAVIARSRQILCITHLAQIASMADNHFYIEKNIQGKNTVTSIRRLSEEESVEELARILGGTTITATTLQSAKEMKEMADASKKY